MYNCNSEVFQGGNKRDLGVGYKYWPLMIGASGATNKTWHDSKPIKTTLTPPSTPIDVTQNKSGNNLQHNALVE
jgi:hypothetical protein